MRRRVSPNSIRLPRLFPGAAIGTVCEDHWPASETYRSAHFASAPPASAASRVNQRYCSFCCTAPRSAGGGRLLEVSAAPVSLVEKAPCHAAAGWEGKKPVSLP